jgi:hypothetical protein
LGHRLVFAEIAETNLPLIGNPGYSDFGSALRNPWVNSSLRSVTINAARSESIVKSWPGGRHKIPVAIAPYSGYFDAASTPSW